MTRRIAISLLLLTCSLPAWSDVFNVDSIADAVDVTPGDGICATAGAVCTLRAAIQEVNALSAGAPHTINVPAGTFALSIPGRGEGDAETGDLDITRTGTTINGAGADLTIIDGGGVDRVFEARTCCFKNYYLSGMTIQNGDPGADVGGGVFNNASRMYFTGVTIKNNTATNGGAIDSPTSLLSLIDSTISDNTATIDGGAIRSGGFNPTLALVNVTINGNSAANGGGILQSAGTANLTNVTLTGNGSANLVQTGGTINVTNSIVADSSTGPNCAGSIASQGFNLDSANTCGFSQPGDLIDTDPDLGPLQDNGGATFTRALPASSPAVDAGTNTGCPAADQRGVARPFDGDWDLSATCDIGAYESDTPPTSISGTVFEDVNYGGGPGRDLSAASADAPSFSVERGNVTVELYGSTGSFLASTATSVADGSYTFGSLAPDTYTVRVVNATVTSSRPGGDGSELGVQTYRSDGDGESAGTGATRVGGERPSNEDAAANSGAQSLAMLQGTDLDADGVPEWTQSIVVIDSAAGDVAGVDFGFNFDVVVNTNNAGQGTLRQFIVNANLLN